jgi:lambda family phage portal protein
MLHLGELSDYREAQILKQRMAALLAGVVTTTDDAAGPASALAPLGALEPGALVGLPPGQDIKWTDPPKVDGFADFTADTDRQIAAGLGITYEALTGNLTGVNFSSGRMGRMEMDRNVERWQALVVAQFCRLVEKWTHEAERLVPDNVSGRGTWSLDWTPPRRALIDPTKEIPALRTAVDAGFLSRARVQRQLGVNPETVRAERADDLKKDKDAGLPPPPQDTGAAGAAPDPGPVVSPDDL